jgi:putative DNA primase/helicase
MTRKLPGETIKPFRAREVTAAALPIKTAIEEWAAKGVVTLLQEIRPASIANLGDRQNDIVEPLLCIAQLAGDEWLQRLTESLKMIFNIVGEEDDSTGAALLTDVRAAFGDSETHFLTSTDLAFELNAQEGHPWADWSNGRPMTTNQLARQLRKFRVYPTKIRLGSETVRGYKSEDFVDLWARFCPEQSACSGSCSGCDKCSTAA